LCARSSASRNMTCPRSMSWSLHEVRHGQRVVKRCAAISSGH
jgi:CxxC motif-containing protein